MKIGIVSDSHDRLPALAAALAAFRRAKVTAIVHAGDFVAPFAAQLVADEKTPVHCVYGNNDGERAGLVKVLPQIQDGPLRLDEGGRTVVVAHAAPDFGPVDLAGADVAISGHTHKPVSQRTDGVLFINPGECCGWLTGRCTAAILDTEDLSVEMIELTF